jgi:SAM-dependent methyltransferase
MNKTVAGLRTHAPNATISAVELKKLINEEQVKYLKCWEDERYRKWSPGEQCVDLFLETAKPEKGETLVDWGCGTGRASVKLADAGLDVTLIDFASNCLDPVASERLGDKFIEHDLTRPTMLRADYGYCCDVMEHIPEEDVDKVLTNILQNSLHVFFQISTVEDHFSHVIDVEGHLHLTVKPYAWWLQKFVDFGCIVHYSNEFPSHCIFYVTGHKTFIFNRGVVNTDPETVMEHMRENAKSSLPQLTPHDEQDTEIMMLCGGPSLKDYWDEIKEQRESGMPLVTVNGTYNQCIERGLNPSLQFVIDARPHNKRFVLPTTDECKYIVATQCHPELVAEVPEGRSYLWQVTVEDKFLPIIEELWGKIYEDWFPVPGGSTVTLRALCALQMLGFRKIHMYGFDSCMMDDEHHAYRQDENNEAPQIDLRVGKGTKFDKLFRCQGWMATQAKEFQLLTPVYFQNLKLNIKGDGLIAYLVKTNAQLEEK